MSTEQILHPSVQQFKQFFHEHPLLMKEVNEGRKSLQELYEEWAVLGTEHEQWQEFKEKKTVDDKLVNDGSDSNPVETADSLGSFMSLIKEMNIDEVQSFLGQLSSILENVQGVMQLFQQNHAEPKQQQHDFPFSFKQD